MFAFCCLPLPSFILTANLYAFHVYALRMKGIQVYCYFGNWRTPSGLCLTVEIRITTGIKLTNVKDEKYDSVYWQDLITTLLCTVLPQGNV